MTRRTACLFLYLGLLLSIPWGFTLAWVISWFLPLEWCWIAGILGYVFVWSGIITTIAIWMESSFFPSRPTHRSESRTTHIFHNLVATQKR
jgi:hypothetical protein